MLPKQGVMVGDRRCWLDAVVVGKGEIVVAGWQDWSKPQCFSNLGSSVDWGCTEENIDVCVLDHEHFGCSADGCVAGITVVAYREEGHVQVWDAMALSDCRWKSKRQETF